jgi:hypothetical protein
VDNRQQRPAVKRLPGLDGAAAENPRGMIGALAKALDPEWPIREAVMLDFVNPSRSRGRPMGGFGLARDDEPWRPVMHERRTVSDCAHASNFWSVEIQPPEPLFPVHVVLVQFPAGETKQTIRLQHIARGKIFVRILHCSLRVLGRDPSVGGATSSEYGRRRHVCLLQRSRELVSCQHLIPPARNTIRISSVAVGTRFASRPPHRTVQAAFPHTAPTLGV